MAADSPALDERTVVEADGSTTAESDGMMADATSPDDPNVGGFCGGSIANVGPWARTGECVFVIPVGQTYVIQPTLQDGTPLADKITITASPGRIKLGQSGSATAAPSP
jgi:hypothetical protein